MTAPATTAVERYRVRPCECGSINLVLRSARLAEDAMASWIQCKVCGNRGEETDDAYSDPDGAVDRWNREPHLDQHGAPLPKAAASHQNGTSTEQKGKVSNAKDRSAKL